MKCGQPVSVTPAPIAAPAVAMPQTPSAVPPPAKSGGLGKIIFAVVLVFAVLAMLAAGAVFYGVYWAKKKVATYSATMNPGTNSGDQIAVAHGNSCALLSAGELQQILGVKVERTQEITEGDNPGCAYFTNDDGVAQLRKMIMQQAKRDSDTASKKPAPKADNPLELLKNTKDLEGIVKSLSMQEPPKDSQVFSFTVDRRGGEENWTAMKTALSIVPGFEEVQGVGDHAMIGSFGHAFYALKGHTTVTLNTIYVPDAAKRGADIARRIFARL
ncbi:MAG TPA: hypothetical protein VGI13_06275 [Candidatus Acidoferrum sp.]